MLEMDGGVATGNQRLLDQLVSGLEGCESGRIGRSRKPLWVLPTVGSNPTPSAKVCCDR